MNKQSRPVKNCHWWLWLSQYKMIVKFYDKYKETEKITKVDIIRAAITHFFSHDERAMIRDIRQEKDE